MLIIHPPERIDNGRTIEVRVPIEYRGSEIDLPDQLWYEFPADCAEFLDLGMESFVAGLLPLAMTLGEDIQVVGTLSPKFAFHAARYQRLRQLKDPNVFQGIDLRADGFETIDPPARARGAGLMFSGGVDSMDVLLDHLPDQMPYRPYQLTHGIFLFHFDQRSYQRAAYEAALEIYQGWFEQLGLTLIPADYNLKRFRPPRSPIPLKEWVNRTHGAGLMSVGMLLGRGLARLYLSASDTIGSEIEYGTSALTDHLMSTERFEIIHEGFDRNRSEKLERLAKNPQTYDYLRVCWWQHHGVQNCGRCHKCVRTMTTLAVLDKLTSYRTFSTPLTTELILRRGSTVLEGDFVEENLSLARRRGRTKYVWLLTVTLALSRLRALVRRWVQVLGLRQKGSAS